MLKPMLRPLNVVGCNTVVSIWFRCFFRCFYILARYGASILTLRKGENLRGVSSTLRKGENWRQIGAKSFSTLRKRLLGDVSILWLPPVLTLNIINNV